MKENIKLNSGTKYDLFLQIKDAKTNEILEQYFEKNLVVANGKSNVAQLLGGGSGAAITKIGVGTSTTLPADGDTALTTPFYKALSSVSYPTANKVRFDFQIAAGDANGMAITEWGLLTNANVLCARKTRAVINKTSAFSISGYWIIEVN